ncbi:MAG: hypothetical protein HS100_01850 [Anaerolineales bacterium]|nr:MAG: hypothetical protein EDM79_07860 [Chloroflexota bacterium]MBE7432637.1 hypothetical protein [Anaerolineales bacterium]MCE7861255.1 hypothetical protein [Chloroflexi bacterium CFX2]MCK6582288.1 hypothetical protein [Anaerolineales bacterium]GJQ37003.1 MAG: hypothetical protein JETCAE01_30130 [Anaerolineaceae bacterium]
MNLSILRQVKQNLHDWLEKRRKAELERIQERLNQEQWQNSLANRAHESDLAAGYNLSHFNTMQ